MTEEIKQMFAEHEPAAGRSLGFDADDLVAGGKRRRKRRTVGVVAGAVLTAAVLAAGAVTLPSVFTDRSDATVEKETGQPEYPFPDLEPPGDGYRYEMSPDYGKGKESEAADSYGRAFTAWFETEKEVTFEDWPGMRVYEDEIYKSPTGQEGEMELTGDSLPRYRLAPMKFDNGFPTPLSLRFDDREYTDGLGLSVYPRGSFTEGPGEELSHLIVCEDGRQDFLYTDRTCSESTGPDGEQIITSTEVITEGEAGGPWQVVHNAVVYRTDGTAVAVFDRSPAMDDEEPPTNDFEPYLSLDELTDLALSMPDTVVKR